MTHKMHPRKNGTGVGISRLPARAMESFRFAQLTMLTLIEELDRANMLAQSCADMVDALWTTAKSQCVQAMQRSPLIAGRTIDEASL